MGLDMYLQGHTRLNIKGIKIDKKYDKYNPSYIICKIGYWRKANAIHRYFENLAGELNNCQDYEFEIGQLKELKKICTRILNAKGDKQKELANELLPTQSGFFFGGTDLENEEVFKYYLECLENTVDIVKRCEDFYKDTGGNCWFSYYAWW